MAFNLMHLVLRADEPMVNAVGSMTISFQAVQIIGTGMLPTTSLHDDVALQSGWSYREFQNI